MATPKPKTFEDYLKEAEGYFQTMSPAIPEPYVSEDTKLLEEEMKKLDRPVKEEVPPTPSGTRRGDEPIEAGTVPLPMAAYDPLTMKERSVPLYSDESKKIMRDQDSSYRLVYEVATRDLVAGSPEAEAMEKVSPERLEEEMLNEDLGWLHYGFSTFQLPESILWTGAAYVAQALPTPDTYVGERASDAFATSWNTMAQLGALEGEQPTLLGDLSRDDEQLKAKEEYDQKLHEQGKRFYSALSTGKVYEEGAWGSTYDETTMVGDMLTPFGFDTGIEIPMARGKDIIDSLISKEEAVELAAAAEKAGNSRDAAVFKTITTDSGREWVGLAAELAIDPLWLLGPAKGGQVVRIGGKAFYMSPDVVKAVNAVNRTGKTLPESQKIVVGAIKGNLDDQKALQEAVTWHQSNQTKFADNLKETQRALENPELALEVARNDIVLHTADLERSLARRAEVADVTPAMIAEFGTREKALSVLKAQNAKNVKEAKAIKETVEIQQGKLAAMTDAAAAEKYLKSAMKQELAAVGVHKRQAAQISRMLEAGFDGQKALSTAGTFTFHIPFTSKAFNPIQRTFKMNAAVGDTLASISARTGVNADDLARLNKMTEVQLAAKIENGERIVVGLGGGGLKGLVPDFILAKGDNLIDPLRVPNIRNIKTKIEVSPNLLTKGEKLAYMLSEGGNIVKTPLYLLDALATVVGTRWWRPYMAQRQFDAGMQYFRRRGVDPKGIQRMMSHGDKALIRLMQTAPDIWEAYQTAYGKRISDINRDRDKLLAILERIDAKAVDIANDRLAKGSAYAGTTGQMIMDEAVGYIEKGMLHRFPAELNTLYEDIVELQRAVAAATGRSEEEVRQALQNMARFLAGDVEKFREITAEVAVIKSELSDIAVQAITKMERELENVKAGKVPLDEGIQDLRKASDDIARAEARLPADKALVGKPGKVTDMTTVTPGDPLVLPLVTDPKPKEKPTLKFAREAKKAAKEKEKRMRGEVIPETRGKKPELLRNIKNYKKLIADIDKQESLIESVIKKYRSKIPGDMTDLMGKQPYIRELNASLESLRTKRTELSEMLKKQEIERPRIKVDEKRAAGPYARGLQDWEMDYWEKYQDIVSGYKKQGFTQEQMLMAVMRTMTAKAEDVKELSKRFTGTEELGKRVLPPKEISAEDAEKIADLELEKQLLADEGRGLKPESRRAKAIGNRTQRIDAQLERIKAKEDVAVVEGVAERAAYPTVMTERFVDAPEDIMPLVEEFEDLFEGYKKRFDEQGMTFVKEPIEIMQDFGVVDYVPHLRHEPGKDITKYVSSGDARTESLITGNTDQELTRHLSMNAAKLRSLQGTIEEINTMVKPGTTQVNWEFTMHPALLHARMMNSSRGLASHEMFLTFLRTGVIRGFDDVNTARSAGFVPVMERNSYGLQMQMLMAGTLTKADGTRVAADEVERMLMALIDGDESVQPLVNWARDISEFNNMVNVEKAVGVINALQLEAKAVPGNTWLAQFLVDGDVLDIGERFTSIRNAKHTEHLDNLSTKRNELASKPKITDKQSAEIDRLDELLDPTSDAHKVNLRRISNSSWKDVEKEVNSIISKVNNATKNIPERQVYDNLLRAVNRSPLQPLSASNLTMYFDPDAVPVMKMYVPEQVQESLRMLTSRTAVREGGKIGKILTPLWNVSRRLNNWWKTLVTVISPMFHVRNEMGNVISNMLDVGVGGVLNLDTNIKSAYLSLLMDLHSRYGSVEKARKALAAPRKTGEKAVEFAYRKQMSTMLSKLDADKGVDLGDGLIRTWDEAIELMVDNGVMSGNANYRLDIDRASDFFMERAHELSMAEREAKISTKAKNIYSKIEDAGAVGLSMLASGLPIPLAMTKKMGTTLATRLENRSRAVNFIANLKRGNTVPDSAEHVKKFLFDYNDLTPRQKDYMRQLMPFFTWTQKNFLLQVEMMRKNPAFFANFDRLFYGTLPMIGAHIEQEEARMAMPPGARGEDQPIPYNVMIHRQLERVQYYPEYKLYRVRVPGSVVGMPAGYEFEGFGLPQESFAEYMHKMQNMTKVKPGETFWEGHIEGMLASTHWVARGAYAWTQKRDPFYQEDLQQLKMREANDIANVMHTLENLGPGFEPMRIYIREAFGVTPLSNPRKPDEVDYYFGDDAFSEMGLALKYVPNPFERAMREGAMVQDAFYRSMMTKEAKMDENVVPERLPFYLRLLNATMGIKIKQQASTDYLRSQHERDMKNVMFDQTDSLGLTENGKVKK